MMMSGLCHYLRAFTLDTYASQLASLIRECASSHYFERNVTYIAQHRW